MCQTKTGHNTSPHSWRYLQLNDSDADVNY
jgi:hypothetical protein